MHERLSYLLLPVGDILVAFFQNRWSWFLWRLVVLWPLARTAALDALLRSVDVLT